MNARRKANDLEDYSKGLQTEERFLHCDLFVYKIINRLLLLRRRSKDKFGFGFSCMDGLIDQRKLEESRNIEPA